MLSSSSTVIIYFMIFTSGITVYCQSVQYTLQKISSDSHPNEQPLLLLGRKQSHLAVPQFSNNIPQLEFKFNEELVLACPENSFPGGTTSAVNSREATSSAENFPGQLPTIAEEGRIDQTTTIIPSRMGSTTPSREEISTTLTPIAETENQLSSVALTSDKVGTAQSSSSTFDSVPSTPMTFLPQIPVEPRKRLVPATVTKKKAKFYASDIKFPWELPYLKCEHPAQAFVRKVIKTKGRKNEIEPCEDNGGKYEVGFWVKIHKTFASSIKDALRLGKNRKSHKKAYEWYPLITVCFNMYEWKPVYTKHTLYGSAIKAAAKLMLRPNNFDYEELFRPYDEMDPSVFYNRNVQYKIFESILGTDVAFTYNDTVSKFLIPLQLVDPAEMPTPVSTLATYSFMTTTPSWEGVALRNWRILTKTVLTFADENQLNLVIYSGTANILQLQTMDGKFIDIRLKFHDKTLAVSKILYKLVHNELTNEAIIFFVFNNPYVNDSSYQVCIDICESAGWANEVWKNLDRGYTTCCKYDEVISSFASLPQIKTDNMNLLKNHRPHTEPALTERNETNEPLGSESGVIDSTEVVDRPSTSYFAPLSRTPEIESV